MHGNTTYVFCKIDGEVLCAYKGWLNLDYSDTHYQVKHLTPKDTNTFDTSAPMGTMIFNGINGTYTRMETKGNELEMEKTKNKDWYKIKDKNEYLLKNECSSIIKKIKDDVIFNSIENVDVPIKAGEIVGVPSKYGVEKQKSYSTVHLEVFTDDAHVKTFINNTTDKDRTTYEVEKDKTLQVAKPCNFLKKDTYVKIYEIKEDYTEIGFEDVFYEITDKTTHLIYIKKTAMYVEGKKENKATYTIVKEHFDEVNKELKNLLPKEDTKVYLKKQLAGNKRMIGYGTENSGKKYWVKTSEVTGMKDDWVKLTADITSIYEKEPTTTTTDHTVTKTTKIRKVSTTKDNEDIEWWQVKAKEQQGWIKKSELTEKNPYIWADYNWELLEDTGDQYFYMFGDFVENSEPHNFIKKIWKEAETNKDNELSANELQHAMRNKSKLENISKLICKHQNEWNTQANISNFETEIIDLYKKGIEQEEDATLKQGLEKQRDDKIAMLKDKIKKLCFWDKITSGDIVPEAKRRQDYINKNKSGRTSMLPNGTSEEEICLGNEFDALEKKRTPRQFPKDSSVYHFHPIAFVEQMKMITGGRAPWMEIAYREFGVEEIERDKHNDKILEYHNSSNTIGNPDEIAWCGAYVNWVMKQAGFKDNLPDAPSKAVRWKKYGKSLSKDNPPYGAIACIAWTKDINWGAGHIGFVVAVKGDTYYLLGGNQTGGDKTTKGKVCISSYKKPQILSVNIPSNYDLTESDYKYDKMNKSKSGYYETLKSTR